ncbi:ribonuclease III [Arenimonas sp. GDDSR-1]|uniref:ribonuclease III n=1 Tax=Arenimonas sp. GDDSR-1 TaxID=2950125 RepID=UPI0026079554|nr:ribonuclease III [Arenimonas sp. GDDSR-1]
MLTGFRDPELLRQALRHRSAGKPNNERLEFLGDAVLGMLVSDALYRKFPKASEGELTQARSHLVRESTLAEIGREQDLGARLELGPGEMKSGGHRRDSILADAVEAVIAAVYLDSGFPAARQLVDAWFGSRLHLSLEKSPGKDPKTKLQEWLQSKQHALPVYRLIRAGGSDHERTFDIECVLEHLAITTAGSGSSVKSAEADAARKALILLGQEK